MPESLEDKILQYPALSREEQREVEARVQDRPELQALLREAKALEDVLAEARLLVKTPPGDEALAHYLVTERLGSKHALPKAVRSAHDRVKAHLEEHPEERERLRTFEERLNDVEAESTDPARQFEELTGHALADEAEQPPSEAREPSDARYRSEQRPERAPDRDSSARVYQMATRWSRRAAVAALLVAGLYGALFLASRASQSETERLAAFSDEELSVQGYRMRDGGASTPTDSASADARYLRALASLRKARSSTLGLFPRYDAERLRRAERLLRKVTEQTESDSFLHLEALYFLGKTQLAMGQREAARTSLRRVIEGQGRKAGAAREVLRTLEDA
jgi:flagellar biosynthesis GTPase FlhF